MEEETFVDSRDIKVEVKKESQDDETVTNQTNTDLETSTDEKVRIKNEPLEDQAGSSSLKITNYYSVPNFSMNTASSVLNHNSLPSTLHDSNNSATSLLNGVVKTETEDTSTTPSAESTADIDDSNRSGIKKEPDDHTSCNSSQSSLPLTNAIKKESTIDDVKKENRNPSVVQNDLNNANGSLQNPSSAIASILTASIPSTSSATNDQSDDVSSSADQKPVCRYGKSCYRLNELHRGNFYHPPGSDPLKSPEKPRCKYGSRCYRKSEEHRKRFIHDRSPDNALSNTRKRKVRNTASQTTTHVYESDSDDGSLSDESYDYSSDEFHPDDTDSDETDFEPDFGEDTIEP